MNYQFQNLLFLARMCLINPDLLNTLRNSLSDPSRLSWPRDTDLLDNLFQEFQKYLVETSLFHLLQVSILSSFLLSQDQPDDRIKHWLIKNLDTERILSKIDLDEAFSFKWQTVPLISVGDGDSRINYFMIGTGKNDYLKAITWPEWFGKCIDDDAQQAVHDAVEIAERTSGRSSRWYLFGLVPLVPRIIRGRSLALPLALAARALLENKTACPGYIATGDLNMEHGAANVEPVRDIPLKWNEAKGNGFTLFLYPQGNVPGTNLPDDIKSIPVANFENCWMWATLYSQNRLESLRSLEVALQSPETFVAMSEHLDVDCLKWCADSKLVRQYLQTISKDIYQIDNLGRKLKNRYDQARGNYELVAAMTALFDSSDSIAVFGKISPVTALLWCSTHLALANHGGDLKKSGYWFQQGMKYHDSALKEAEGRSIVTQFVIRSSSINQRHNQYDFRPSLPEIFMKLVHQHEKINQAMGCTVDYRLGTIYGTIAQNFAFCGPNFLGQTKKYISQAQVAFGGGTVPKLKNAWIIQFSYLYFALIECGEPFYSDAKDVLCRYLEIKNAHTPIENIPDKAFTINGKPNGFPLFAILRGLTDMPESFSPAERKRLAKRIFQIIDELKIESFLNNTDQIHPWQLIAYNAGRLAIQLKDLQRAYQAFKKSITLCRYGEDTINAMALLPLSQIWQTGEMDKDLEKNCLDVLKRIRESAFTALPSHFKVLTDTHNVADALERVFRNPEKFFPYNYR